MTRGHSSVRILQRGSILLQTTPQSIFRLITRQATIPLDMTLRLDRLFGFSSTYWVNRQQGYELGLVTAESRKLPVWNPSRLLPATALNHGGITDGY